MHLELTDRREIAEGTMAFWFKPERLLRFKAGQFGEFMLPDLARGAAKGNSRTFSLASSPQDQTLMIATRMSTSAFKESLRRVPMGTGIEFMGPMGAFTLPEDTGRLAVFLTGGIGITPVRSMVEWATQEQSAHRISVFYSNRTRAATAFLQDFQDWAQANPRLSFIPTLTDEQPQDWGHELGPIDESMLRRHIEDLQGPVYHTVGPPAMVAAMKTLLGRIGIEEERIRAEDFVGY